MPLTKQQKADAVDEIVSMLQDVPTLYLTDYQGLNVEQATELRNRFRKEGVSFKVVKNTLLKLAMERVGGLDDLFDHLSGPTAIAYCSEPAAPARVIKKFSADTNTQLPALKVAYVGGSVYQSDALDVLAALKSRDELIGEIAGLLTAPVSNIVGSLGAQGGNLLSVIKAIEERAES